MPRLGVYLLFWAVIAEVRIANSMAIKRSASPDNNLEQVEGDSFQINYDEYPMVVPKRAAMLFERLMMALHHALEDSDKDGDRNGGGGRKINEVYHDGGYYRSGKKSISSTNNKMTPYIGIKSNSDEDIEIEMPTGIDSRSIDEDIRQSNEPQQKQQQQQQQQKKPHQQMDLQRRGHDNVGPNKGRVYWRCYFNAVTCF